MIAVPIFRAIYNFRFWSTTEEVLTAGLAKCPKIAESAPYLKPSIPYLPFVGNVFSLAATAHKVYNSTNIVQMTVSVGMGLVDICCPPPAALVLKCAALGFTCTATACSGFNPICASCSVAMMENVITSGAKGKLP